MKTLIRWVIILVVVGWAGYTVAAAAWSYFAVREVVDKTLREAVDKNQRALLTGSATDSVARDVRGAIVMAARRDGLPVEEDNVRVAVTSAGIAASVSWPYPVITYGGSDVLIIPLSVERSSAPAP